MAHSRPALGPTPEMHSAGRVTVYVNPAASEDAPLGELLRLPDIVCELPGQSSRRHGTATVWHWRRADTELVVRQYAHGGVLGRVAGTAFLGRRRMLNEFRLANHAFHAGVPTAVPVALRTERGPGPFIKAHLVTRKVPDAADLLQLAADLTCGAPLSHPQRRRLAAAVASAVASMHDAGIVHADLNVKNILVQHPLDGPRAFVIDFDKATLTHSVPFGPRMANLARLDRSASKWAATRAAFTGRDRLAVLRHYLTRYPEWRERTRSVVRRCAGKRMLHRASRQPD